MNIETLDALTRDNHPIYVDEVMAVTELGEEGAKVVTGLANREGMTFSRAKSMTDTAYRAGFTGVSEAQVAFDNKVQEAAFRAGKYDRAMQDGAKQAAVKNAAVYDGAFTENEYTKNYTKAEKKMVSIFAKALRMDISAVDEIIANEATGAKANARHTDGKMEIANFRDAEKVIYQMIMHEGGHRMRQLAPSEFGVLMNALYKKAEQSGRAEKLGVKGGTVFDAIKAEHDNAGISMDMSGYVEEVAVRELEHIFSSAREFNKWYAEISGNAQLRSSFDKFIDWVLEVIEDIKTALKNAKLSDEEKAEAKKNLAELEHIKDLYANAIKASESAATELANKKAEGAVAENATTAEGGSKTEEKSSNNLDIKTNEEYNGSIQYSVKAQSESELKYLYKDSEGDTLTQEQQEYFKDSKVRDENGNLLVMYQGANEDFTVFDRKKSKYSNLYGRGFYFTKSESHAKQYGNTRAYYLDIKHPVSTKETTITQSQLRKFLEAVTENEDYSFENYGYDATVDSVLQTTYGKSDFLMLNDVSQTAIGDLVEAIELFNKVNGTEFDGIILDTETITFNSEQAKLTSNEKPTSNPDINFSLMSPNSTSSKDTKALLETIEHLKNEFEVTKFAKADRKELAKMTKKLLKDYSSKADVDEIFGAIDKLYQYLANGEDGHTAAWDEVYDRAYNIAEEIVKSAIVLDDEMYVTYKSLRDYLRSTPMKFDTQYDGVPSGYDNFQDFRRRNYGRLNFRKDGIGVDGIYQELSSLYPEFFNADEQMNTADQLERIIDVLDELQPSEINPYSREIKQTSNYLANDIIDRFFDIPQAKPTFADKAERRVVEANIKGAKKVETVRQQKDEKIQKLIEAQRIKTKRQLDKLREQRDKSVKKEREKRRDAISRMNESQKAKVLRAKIMRSVAALYKRLRKGTDKSHIPAGLDKAVTELLYNINLESNYTYDPATDSYKKNDKGLPTNKTKAFLALKEIYAKMLKEEDSGLSIAPELASKTTDDVQNIFDKITGTREDKITIKSDVKIADMTLEELTDVYDAIRMIEHSIAKANKLFSDMKQETLDELGRSFENSVATRRANKALLNLSIDIKTPLTFFSHFGDAGLDLYKALRKAQDNEEKIVDELAELVNGIVSSEEVKKANKEMFEFTTAGGEKLTLSKAHLMNIYLLYNRNQGKKHILFDPENGYSGWGIIQPEIAGVLPNVPKVSKGLESVRLTKSDLGDMVLKLSEEDKQTAKKLQKATLLLAEWGNKACLEVFGYEKFKDADYWTIKSADIVLNKDTGKSANDKTRALKNMGSAKNTDDNATNAVEIDSVFDLFAQHASDMIRYSAWLGVVEDASRLSNYTFKDEAGFKTNRKFRAMLEKFAGNGGAKYYDNLLKDIQNGLGLAPDTTVERIYTKLFSLAAKGKVAFKATVVAQQGMAIIRAATVINPISIIEAIAKGGINVPVWAVRKVENIVSKQKGQASEWYGGWERALKHAPIASRKAIGGYEINSNSSGLKDVLYKPKMVKGKTVNALKESPLWAAGKADEIAWGILWNACEFETNKNKALEKGSEEYYEAVAELFADVINESQVVDGVLQRSQMMRSSSGWIKPLTVFKGEPTMALNGVMRAYDNVRYEKDKAKRGKAIRQLSRTTSVFVITAIFTAFARSLAVGGTGDDDDKYWKKVWKSFSGVQGDEETWFDYVKNIGLKSDAVNNINPLSWLPLVSEVMSFAQGYDVERLDVASIGEFLQAGKTFIDSIDDESKHTFTYATRNLLLKYSELTGYSPYNLVKDIEGAIRTTRNETDDVKGLYEMEKWRTKPAANVSAYVDILYKAYTTDRKAYEYIYNDMIKNGVDADKIKNGMETRMKKAEGVKEVSDLSKRYMTPDDEKKYDSSLKRVQSSRAWKSATTTQRKDAEADLYDFLTSDSKDMEKTRAEARAFGVDETEYTLWQLAIEMADQTKGQKGSGSYDYKEKAEAINLLNLGDKEIAYFFGKGMNETSKEELNETLNAGIDIQEYVNFKAAVSEMKADKNAKGNSIPNSKKRKVVSYLNNADLTDEEWEYFYYEIMNYKR